MTLPVSVVIVSHNKPHLVKEAVASVVAQTLPPIPRNCLFKRADHRLNLRYDPGRAVGAVAGFYPKRD